MRPADTKNPLLVNRRKALLGGVASALGMQTDSPVSAPSSEQISAQLLQLQTALEGIHATKLAIKSAEYERRLDITAPYDGRYNDPQLPKRQLNTLNAHIATAHSLLGQLNATIGHGLAIGRPNQTHVFAKAVTDGQLTPAGLTQVVTNICADGRSASQELSVRLPALTHALTQKQTAYQLLCEAMQTASPKDNPIKIADDVLSLMKKNKQWAECRDSAAAEQLVAKHIAACEEAIKNLIRQCNDRSNTLQRQARQHETKQQSMQSVKQSLGNQASIIAGELYLEVSAVKLHDTYRALLDVATLRGKAPLPKNQPFPTLNQLLSQADGEETVSSPDGQTAVRFSPSNFVLKLPETLITRLYAIQTGNAPFPAIEPSQFPNIANYYQASAQPKIDLACDMQQLTDLCKPHQTKWTTRNYNTTQPTAPTPR